MVDSPFSMLFSNNRLSPSTIERSSIIEDFYGDRSRIIFCSSFRRLQQKAQVFSLEPNASVRTRMTHTLEVADIGRTLASKIALGLRERKLLSEGQESIFVAIVENACLLHDIGNPPFGHFGENAIREWARGLDEIAKHHGFDDQSELYKQLIRDFYEYDGNPQGFRIITRLHPERDRYSLNLSYATLLATIKYARSAGESGEGNIYKKAGYFQSEKHLVDKMCSDVGRDRNTRFPLTYIMEAADDISYCLSDISDGIEKNIITLKSFLEYFNDVWSKEYEGEICPIDLTKTEPNFNLAFSVPISRKVVDEAAIYFLDNYDEFLYGKIEQLIPNAGSSRVLDAIKKISKKTLYSSIEAESIELTGYAVITGILQVYQRLLELKYSEFESLVLEIGKELEYERRLFNRIGKRYRQAYKYMLDEVPKDENFALKEWWARVHLIIDHISGMTDEFALNTYQMIKGINLLPV